MEPTVTARILIFLLTFYGLSLSRAQPFKVEWQRCVGGSDLENNGNPGISSLAYRNDGSVVFVCRTYSDDGDITGTGYHAGANGAGADGDIYIANITSDGIIAWSKSLGGSLTEGAYSIAKTIDRGFVIAGSTASNDGDITEGILGDVNGWIVKVDTVGAVQWDRTIGGSAEDWFNAVIQTSDGGYIAAGQTASHDELWLHESWVENHSFTPPSVIPDAMIFKLDSTGKTQWKKLYGGSWTEEAMAILEVPGGYIFAGIASSPDDGDVKGIHGDINFLVPYDIWVVRLDMKGAILWQRCYGGTNVEYVDEIIRTSDGGFLITGLTSSSDGDVSFLHGMGDAWLLKIDSAGTIEWERSLGGSSSDAAASAIEISDGYVFVGSTNSVDGDVTGLHRGVADSADIWIGELSLDGKLRWQQCLGGTRGDEGHAIAQTSDGDYVVYGTTYSNNGDVSGNHGGSDAWVVKLHPSASAVEATSGSSGFAYPYPNPATKEIRLRLYHSLPVKQIQFFNLMGTQYFPEFQTEHDEVAADVHTLPPGVYILRVTYVQSNIQEVRKFLVAD